MAGWVLFSRKPIMEILRIRNWDDNFENNRTRELKNISWVPVPNSFDGDGFTVLTNHKNGIQHYGAWILILGVASKCEMRGTLLRRNKKPHDSASLSRMTGVSKEIFDEVIPRLLDNEIGWLEIVDEQGLTTIPHPPAKTSHAPDVDPAPACLERKKERRKESKKEKNTSPSPPDGVADTIVVEKKSLTKDSILQGNVPSEPPPGSAAPPPKYQGNVFVSIFTRFYQGPMTGLWHKRLKLLSEEFGHDKVSRAFSAYCSETDIKYISAFKFEETLAYWISKIPRETKYVPEDKQW